MTQPCSICGENYANNQINELPNIFASQYICERCGKYNIGRTLIHDEPKPWSEVRHLVSAWIRRENRAGITPTIGAGVDVKTLYSSDWANQFRYMEFPETTNEKMNALLLAYADSAKGDYDAFIEFQPHFIADIAAKNENEITALNGFLGEAGFLKDFNLPLTSFSITAKGWLRIDELRKEKTTKDAKIASNKPSRPLKVFLCHASADKPAITPLYKNLLAEGINVWFDQEKLLPGQNWQLEIPKAVRDSDVVLVCLSAKSINKEGYVQKEIRLALDVADEKPEGTIFIIPARLENCEVPDRLGMYQWVDLFDSDGYRRLIKALNARANEVGAIFSKSSSE